MPSASALSEISRPQGDPAGVGRGGERPEPERRWTTRPPMLASPPYSRASLPANNGDVEAFMEQKKESSLGSLVRLARQQRGWTLREMSGQVGIPVSTLGKIETGKLSLAYDKLEQLTARLGLTMTEFFSQGSGGGEPRGAQAATGRKSVTGDGNSVEIVTANYQYRYLCTDLRDKRMIPVLATIHSHNIGEFGNLVHHQGEEFIFVLEGTIEVHTQYYTPIIVPQGHGIYLDSSMGHAYVAKDCDTARILAVHSSDDAKLVDELLNIPEARIK